MGYTIFLSKSQFPPAKTQLLPVLIAIIVGVGLPSTAFAETDLLSLLKARDAQFDNMLLSYDRSSIHEMRPGAGDHIFNHGKSEKPKLANLDVIHLPVLRHERVLVRGAEVSFWAEVDQSVHEELAASGLPLWLSPRSRWSNRMGQDLFVNEIKDEAIGKDVDITFVSRPDARLDSVQQDLMELEFTLGLGFGKRLLELHEIIETADGWETNGTIELWSGNQSQISLLIDEDLIVRQAKITVNMANIRIVTHEITNKGNKTIGGSVLPEVGEYQRSALLTRNIGKAPYIEAKFTIHPTGIETGLTDSRYEDLARGAGELAPGTIVQDLTTGETYKYDTLKNNNNEREFSQDESRDSTISMPIGASDFSGANSIPSWVTTLLILVALALSITAPITALSLINNVRHRSGKSSQHPSF